MRSAPRSERDSFETEARVRGMRPDPAEMLAWNALLAREGLTVERARAKTKKPQRIRRRAA